jgi:hypothetical protein
MGLWGHCAKSQRPWLHRYRVPHGPLGGVPVTGIRRSLWLPSRHLFPKGQRVAVSTLGDPFGFPFNSSRERDQYRIVR